MNLEQDRLYELRIGETTLILRAKREDSKTWRLEESIPAVSENPDQKPRAFILYRERIKEIMQETPWKRSLNPTVLGKLTDLHEHTATVER